MATIDKLRLSGTTYDIIDATAIHSLNGYSTTEQMNQAITAATNALAESIAEQGYQTASDVQAAINPINSTLTAHTANTDIHVTISDKAAWNAKLDESDVEGFFGAVAYDSNSKRINFYNTSTTGSVLGYVDATDFIKDGMVSNVEIKDVTGKGTCLVITFNSDAGKQAIEIPISQIFDATNYYTKDEVDDAIDAATTGKVDTSTYNTFTAATNTAIAGKQATLVSGTNIKTINNQSILGSGNIEIEQGTVDITMSNTSENAVQNKVIKNYVDTGLAGKNGVITLDGTTLVIS